MSASLVGSEMCIRDSRMSAPSGEEPSGRGLLSPLQRGVRGRPRWLATRLCLLYTSDAADDM
eukprot:6539494-Alexandrium_andersonii.AAC.1